MIFTRTIMHHQQPARQAGADEVETGTGGGIWLVVTPADT
jgi:hypothetical protein